MKQQSTRGAALLLLAAFIWGVAFVAQSEGGDAVGAYTFNCIRFLIGGVVLLPWVLLSRREQGRARKAHTLRNADSTSDTPPADALTVRIPAIRRRPAALRSPLLVGGLSCGLALAAASNLQQVAITAGASAGKAGFLTACYIILVPIAGMAVGRTCPPRIWIAVGIALVGLYLLCLSERLVLTHPDILLLCCAAVFTVQILLIDHFAPRTDSVVLSCLQFFVCGGLSLIPALHNEILPDPQAAAASLMTADAWRPILFAGVLSTGVAYTLQIIGQKNVHPTIASLLMSLESVFAVLAGWLLLQERLSPRELCGCLLIFVAIVLAQADRT